MKIKAKKELDKRREEVLLELPSFVNQLLLLVNSGTMLDDALKKICNTYTKGNLSNNSYFAEEIRNIYIKSQKNGENIVSSFYQFARFSNVKELTRIANLLLENQGKGVDMFDKIQEMGESLWNERKRIALEKIQLSETKMAGPLGLLLIALIIIAAAPAMMNLT